MRGAFPMQLSQSKRTVRLGSFELHGRWSVWKRDGAILAAISGRRK